MHRDRILLKREKKEDMNRNTRYYVGCFLKRFLPNLIKKRSIYSRLSFTRIASTQIHNKKLSFHCHAEDLSNTIFYTGVFGDYEGQTLKMWHEIIHGLSLKTVMDIGAYSGIFALTAALADEEIDIHAYEPNPFAFKLLTKNCNLNSLSNIRAYECAIAEYNGKQEFYMFGNSYSTGMTSVNHRKVHHDMTMGSFEAKDIFKAREEIDKKLDLIKLDIERAELPLLKHATKLLETDRPIIFCEILDAADYFDYQVLFEALDYGFIQVNDDDHNYTHCQSISDHGNRSLGRNWIFYPKEKQAMIKAVI